MNNNENTNNIAVDNASLKIGRLIPEKTIIPNR